MFPFVKLVAKQGGIYPFTLKREAKTAQTKVSLSLWGEFIYSKNTVKPVLRVSQGTGKNWLLKIGGPLIQVHFR